MIYLSRSPVHPTSTQNSQDGAQTTQSLNNHLYHTPSLYCLLLQARVWPPAWWPQPAASKPSSRAQDTQQSLHKRWLSE